LEHLQGVALVGDGFFFVPFSTKATRFELPLDGLPSVSGVSKSVFSC
jgi:hypothetical protein